MTTDQIGIDLGGTKIEAILLRGGVRIFSKRVPTPSHSYSLILQTVISLVNECQAHADSQSTVGIGMPGSVTERGHVKNSNTVCLNGKPFKADIENALGQQVKVMNDANCFALSESVDGAGREACVVFGVIIGTGLGGGIVINKKPLSGCNGIAGEWGHNPLPVLAPRINQLDRKCYCGKLNCIETYLCGSGIAQSFYEITSKK